MTGATTMMADERLAELGQIESALDSIDEGDLCTLAAGFSDLLHEVRLLRGVFEKLIELDCDDDRIVALTPNGGARRKRWWDVIDALDDDLYLGEDGRQGVLGSGDTPDAAIADALRSD